jgi:hypothetical protein
MIYFGHASHAQGLNSSQQKQPFATNIKNVSIPGLGAFLKKQLVGQSCGNFAQ